MRVQKRNPWLVGLGLVLAAMALSGTRAGADVTSDRPGSIVIWPKVIADGTRDTIITLSNTRNETAYAHCVYINAIGICRTSGALCTLPSEEAVANAPSCPGGPTDICDLGCQADDFDVILTRQQPTVWRVSTGRVDDPLAAPDGACDIVPGSDPELQTCPGFFLVGRVRPPVQPFRGELRCIQVAGDGSPNPANGLKGEATIQTLETAQISTYSSINVRGTQAPLDPAILPLNGVNPDNRDYNVYNACPEAVEFTHYAAGATDLVAASIDPASCAVTGCPVTTEITVIPCRVDYENAIPTLFGMFIQYTNEFEQTLSVSRNLECWTTFTLQNLGFTNVAGSTFQRTRITPSGSGLCIQGDAQLVNTFCTSDAGCGTNGVCAPSSAVLAVVEEFHHSDSDLIGTDAANAFSVDTNGDGSYARAGRCRGALATRCDEDDDCPTGKCRFSGQSCNDNVACGAGDFCDRCMNDEIRLQPDVVCRVGDPGCP